MNSSNPQSYIIYMKYFRKGDGNMLENVVIGIYLIIGAILAIFAAIADQRSGIINENPWILSMTFYFGLIILWPGYLIFTAMVAIFQHINEK